MEQFTGKSIGNGIAIGPVWFCEKTQDAVTCQKVDNAESEIARYEQAKELVIAELQHMYAKAAEEVGQENALIFDVQSMLLEDIKYNEAVYSMIRSEQVNAEYAVYEIGDYFATVFAKMEDEYIRERAADIKDISNQVVAVLTGAHKQNALRDEPVIVVADDLSPGEAMSLDRSKVLAFVSRQGSLLSHTAILAKSMNVPALFGVEVESEWQGKTAIVDGEKGLFYMDPGEELLATYGEQCKKNKEQRKLLEQLKGKPDVTKDGRAVSLYANIGSVADVDNVLANDATGIGLFRSEFLYLEKNNYPTEEEQFQAYKTVVQRMAGKKVVIRTLDIGADKQVDYFDMEHEENPALGYRAIRLCLDRIDLFKTQLRAIYRASAFGNVAIMFPMIISVEEVKKIKQICEEVKQELLACGTILSDVEIGIMIETPAAVMVSDILAKEVNFFSIGTNDLTQYTLAIDRQNAKLDKIYNAHHPAILRMIQVVIDNGHRENCTVGICGELAADLTMTEELIRMGIDELSVAPGMVLPVRNQIINTSIKK